MTFLEYIATYSSDSAVQDKKTMSRQRKGLSQQQKHAAVRKSITTKENFFVTKAEKNHRQNVAIYQIMSHKVGLKGKKFSHEKEILCRDIFQEWQGMTC